MENSRGRHAGGGGAAHRLHKAIQNQVFIPLFATSAETNVGGPPHDFIAKYGSSPLDRARFPPRTPTVRTHHRAANRTVVYIFKTMNEQGVASSRSFAFIPARSAAATISSTVPQHE